MAPRQTYMVGELAQAMWLNVPELRQVFGLDDSVQEVPAAKVVEVYQALVFTPDFTSLPIFKWETARRQLGALIQAGAGEDA